ncbi:esterase/lipase family protein [Planctobacterium marinum]|uniref:esterase/lipase family protein n=1 Tax=Planctobacterium marinum TaxID=1631968 RepID=UPI001E5CF181|nr:alpha/beta hydrolase [Planctobacterium marinum]MCC2605421.1 alpha/beta fold hydrolase [Planctobacterium marinum]
MTAPLLRHTLLESRTILEFAATTLALPFLLRAPSGKHPVMVLPGFLAGDNSTLALRQFLKMKGYRAFGWQQGRNLGQHIVPTEKMIREDLLERVLNLVEQEKQPVHLIGWSLGGILAREIARLMPDMVASVISLGSPFNTPEASAPMASRIFKRFNQKRMGDDYIIPPELAQAPPVPCTSIYSRSDGISHWQGCQQLGHEKHFENIEVKGSHLGLGHHPGVIWLIAHRLAANAGCRSLQEWQPLNTNEAPRWLAGDIVSQHNHSRED